MMPRPPPLRLARTILLAPPSLIEFQERRRKEFYHEESEATCVPCRRSGKTLASWNACAPRHASPRLDEALGRSAPAIAHRVRAERSAHRCRSRGLETQAFGDHRLYRQALSRAGAVSPLAFFPCSRYWRWCHSFRSRGGNARLSWQRTFKRRAKSPLVSPSSSSDHAESNMDRTRSRTFSTSNIRR